MRNHKHFLYRYYSFNFDEHLRYPQLSLIYNEMENNKNVKIYLNKKRVYKNEINIFDRYWFLFISSNNVLILKSKNPTKLI